MGKQKIMVIPFRRKKEGKTDYRKRVKLLIASKPRLVVRKSLKHLSAQIIEFNVKGDLIKVAAHTGELKKLGWKGATSNIPAAYLLGILLAKKAKEKKIKEAILDIGLYLSSKGNKLYAVLKGVVEGGLHVPHSDKVFPDEKRLQGKHIEEYAKSLEQDKERYEKQYGKLLKSQFNPTTMSSQVEEIKKKIAGI